MAKEPSSKKTASTDGSLPRGIFYTLLILLCWLPVSPFLVTVTGLRELSLVRELAIVLLLGWGWIKRRQEKLPLVADDTERAVMWILLLSLISVAFVTRDPSAWVWSARYSLLPLGVYWALHPFTISREQWFRLATSWLIWSSFLIILGILMVTVIPKEVLVAWGYSAGVAIGDGKWTGAATLPAFQAVAGGIPRLQATLTGPIQLAGYAILIFFVARGVRASGRSWVGESSVMALAAVALFGTFSRSVWLGALLVWLVWLVRRWRARGERWSIIVGWGAIALTALTLITTWALFTPNRESWRFAAGQIISREGSDQEHTVSISRSLADWRQVGFWGIGFGRSGPGAIQHAGSDPQAPLPRFVDNSYLRWWEELGIPGGIFFLTFVLILIKELGRSPGAGQSLAKAGTALAIAALLTDMWAEAAPVIAFLALAALWHRPASVASDTVPAGRFSLSARSLAATADLLHKWAGSRQAHSVVTLNPEMYVAAAQSPSVTAAIESADLITADGAGLLAAAEVQARTDRTPRWLRLIALPVWWIWAGLRLIFLPGRLQPRLARVTGSDLVADLLQQAHLDRRRVALLGSTHEVLTAAQVKLAQKWPDAQLVLAETGPQFKDETIDPATAAKLVKQVAAAKPDYLFVAFGVPRQERFVTEQKTELNVPVAIGVSGAFDSVLAETTRRAPRWLRALNLEWLWRLILQPQRLPRIWTATWRFMVTFSRDLLRNPT